MMKTKIITLTLASICVASLSLAQRNKSATLSTANDNLTELNLEVYRNATKLNDWNTAIYASHALVVLEQDNFKDTLASLYFISNNPLQTIAVLKPLVKIEESGVRISLMWNSYYVLNDFVNACHWLEKLPKTAGTLAMLADCQLQLKREGEFDLTIKQFAKLSDDLKQTKISVPGERAQIQAKSYIGHLLAISLAFKNQHEEALEIYTDILAFETDFQTAQQNAKALKEIIAQDSNK